MPPSPPLHALIVDDDQDIQLIARVALESLAGWTVSSALDGESGLAVAAAELPQVILLDVTMPGWGGIQTLGALREHPATQGLPVIFLTARVQDAERQAYLDAGALGVIAKPFEVTTLASEILALLHTS